MNKRSITKRSGRMGTGNHDGKIVIRQLSNSFTWIVILTVVTVVSLAVVPWIW